MACPEGCLWLLAPFAACPKPAAAELVCVGSGSVPGAQGLLAPWGRPFPLPPPPWPDVEDGVTSKAGFRNIRLAERSLVILFEIVNGLMKDVVFEQKIQSESWLPGRLHQQGLLTLPSPPSWKTEALSRSFPLGLGGFMSLFWCSSSRPFIFFPFKLILKG